MNTVKGAALVSVLLLATLLSGCLSDGDGGDGDGGSGIDWKEPRSVAVEEVEVDEGNSTVRCTLRLGDEDGHVTQWDVDLRLIVRDSQGFGMLNKTYFLTRAGFQTEQVEGVWNTWYEISVPFDEFSKSKDRIYGFFTRKMVASAWIKVNGETYKYEVGDVYINSAEIPSQLLVENQPPFARMDCPAASYVRQAVVVDGSNSTDDLGTGQLEYEWDWGDGSPVSGPTASPVGTHEYQVPDSYVVTLTVHDSEGLSDSCEELVLIDPILSVSIGASGRSMDPGPHLGDTFVQFTLGNIAPHTVDLRDIEPLLVNSTGGSLADNGYGTAPPDTLAPGTSAVVTVFFDDPEEFVAVWIEIYGLRYPIN